MALALLTGRPSFLPQASRTYWVIDRVGSRARTEVVANASARTVVVRRDRISLGRMRIRIHPVLWTVPGIGNTRLAHGAGPVPWLCDFLHEIEVGFARGWLLVVEAVRIRDLATRLGGYRTEPHHAARHGQGVDVAPDQMDRSRQHATLETGGGVHEAQVGVAAGCPQRDDDAVRAGAGGLLGVRAPVAIVIERVAADFRGAGVDRGIHGGTVPRALSVAVE